ncbi:hypothetical protein ROLI_002170 [Roseobacter fucihabitans]|uniref:Glutamyl-tRNA synthetase n=1 Tax=Roseobacter fucihabitans TaxID=1537242 RepID=A0ABZ2BM11_9RHOB|nr:DUF4202 domain-containing protein [Roseobacter litoralis]MBC6963468.1 hypothetical protein [Roseobacter litoralis]
MNAKLNAVLAAIDIANRADPTLEADETGTEQPEAYLYGVRMTSELDRLFGETASDVLRIAARGQHIERWLLKRAEYAQGRAGYLQWRRDQGQAHGARLAGLMQDAGYAQEACDRVGVLLRKEGIKRDAEVQQLEDVICFTFLKWYFGPFAAKHPEDKVLDIVGKTARKMSDAARARVLSEFDLPVPLADAVKAAA